MWHSDEKLNSIVQAADEFNYNAVDSLTHFHGTHPDVLRNRIEKQNWSFDHDISKKNFTLKTRLLYFIEKLTGIRIGEYKNYRLRK
jgi:hypothetical protein